LAVTTAPLDIVIPVFNGWRQTRICLDALRASTYKPARIVVVDHGSTDETAESLSRDYPEVIHLRGDPDLWWAGATNLGIRWALEHGATFVMLLNNDCYFPPEAIGGLMGHAEEAPNAVIAPVQRDYQTREILVSYAGTLFLLGFPTLVPPGSRSIDTTVRRLIPTKLVLGGRGVVIPAAVFRTVGLLNETELPHYGADHDFYMRCREANVPLYIAATCSICVDSERTTLAENAGETGFSGLVRALSDRRSHRNIRDLSALFRLHYPIRPLYFVGVALNISRFLLMRLWYWLRRLSS